MNETLNTQEIAQQEERLKRLFFQSENCPYGEQVAQAADTWLIKTFSVGASTRYTTVLEWNVPPVEKGLVDLDGTPRGAAVRLLYQSYEYGPEAYIPIVWQAIQDEDLQNTSRFSEVESDVEAIAGHNNIELPAP